MARYVPNTNSPTKLSVLLRGIDLLPYMLSHAKEGPRRLEGPVLYEGLRTRVRWTKVSKMMQLNAHATQRMPFFAVARRGYLYCTRLSDATSAGELATCSKKAKELRRITMMLTMSKSDRLSAKQLSRASPG
jgi:hypothetical protein